MASPYTPTVFLNGVESGSENAVLPVVTWDASLGQFVDSTTDLPIIGGIGFGNEVVALSGVTVTIEDDTGTFLNTTATTIATQRLNLPLAPTDGQIVTIATRGQITLLTIDGNGATVYAMGGGFTEQEGQLNAGDALSYKYTTGGTWDRVA